MFQWTQNSPFRATKQCRVSTRHMESWRRETNMRREVGRASRAGDFKTPLQPVNHCRFTFSLAMWHFYMRWRVGGDILCICGRQLIAGFCRPDFFLMSGKHHEFWEKWPIPHAGNPDTGLDTCNQIYAVWSIKAAQLCESHHMKTQMYQTEYSTYRI